jgi:hypothetical protein
MPSRHASVRLFGLPLAALAALALPAAAQTVLYTFTGTTPNQSFGNSVASAGDVSGDGLPDLLIGSMDDDSVGTDAGAVHVLRGSDGAPLHVFLGEAAGDGLGQDVDGVGDIDGDGLADLIAGEYRHDGPAGANSGRALVWSGGTWSVLLTIDGSNLDDEFGVGVAGLGDLDGDGVPDVGVGAHHDDDNGFNSGSVRCVSGADGSQIHLITGAEHDDDLGHVLCSVGDLDADGVPDILIGLHDNPDPGEAHVYSGATAALLFEFHGHSINDFYGHAVGGPGDANLDGVPDFLIGAERDDSGAPNGGRAWLHDGDTGAVLFDWKGDSQGDLFGSDVCGAGDWNGDGVPDAVIGISGDDPNGLGSGAARFVSGADGAVLLTYDGTSPGPRFAVWVGDAGDVNADGRPDVLLGFPFHNQAAVDAGLVDVLSGALPSWSALPGGLAGVDGVPQLIGTGLLAPGTPGSLRLSGAAPAAAARLFVSLGSTPVPFKGGVLAAFPPIAQLALATNGAGEILLPWPAWPATPAGLALVFQVAVSDAAAVKGASISNPLQGTTK